MIERREFTCNQCGRTRLLSKEEAEDDGWIMHIQKGLTCPHCIDYYGLPKQSIPLTREQEAELARERYYCSRMIII